MVSYVCILILYFVNVYIYGTSYIFGPQPIFVYFNNTICIESTFAVSLFAHLIWHIIGGHSGPEACSRPARENFLLVAHMCYSAIEKLFNSRSGTRRKRKENEDALSNGGDISRYV